MRALGAEVRVCAPPDKEFAEGLAGAGVPLVPAGRCAHCCTGRRHLACAIRTGGAATRLLDAVSREGRQCPRERDGIAGPGKMPGAGLRPTVASDLRSELMT